MDTSCSFLILILIDITTRCSMAPKANKVSTVQKAPVIKKEPAEEKPKPKALNVSLVMPAFRGLRTKVLDVPTLSVTCSERSEFYEAFLSLESLHMCAIVLILQAQTKWDSSRCVSLGIEMNVWCCAIGIGIWARKLFQKVEECNKNPRLAQKRKKKAEASRRYRARRSIAKRERSEA